MNNYVTGVYQAFEEAQAVMDGTGNHSFCAVYRGGTINIHSDYIVPGFVDIDWYPDIFAVPDETETVSITKSIAEFREYTAFQMLVDLTPAMLNIAQQVRDWIQRFDREVA